MTPFYTRIHHQNKCRRIVEKCIQEFYNIRNNNLSQDYISLYSFSLFLFCFVRLKVFLYLVQVYVTFLLLKKRRVLSR